MEVEGLRSTARRYLPDTNILETTFRIATGTLVVRDFMPVRGEVPADDHRTSEHHAGGPDTQAPGALARLLRCTSGAVAARIIVRPTFDYARRKSVAAPRAPTEAVFTVAGQEVPDRTLHVASSHEIVIHGDEASATFILAQGEEGYVLLHGAEAPVDDVATMFEQTLGYWRAWSDRCTYRGEYRDAVLRSILCLKLLTYAPTGAIVAAATAGLPEAVGGPRNWDYRFTWLRDASFTVSAFLNLGYRREAAEFLRFLREADRSRGRDLRILYPIDGVDMAEEALDHLRGWRASRPVLIGNGAADQDQHDIYGEFLSALRLYLDEVGDGLPPAVRDHLLDLVRNLAEAVEGRGTRADRGIWELRSASGHFFHFKSV